MKKKLYIVMLALGMLLAVSGCADTVEPAPDESAEPEPEIAIPEEPAPELSPREKDWVEDINYLREEYTAKHMDPFYYCSEEEFNWKLDRLIGEVSSLSDSDLFFELAAIIAGMGDSHTNFLTVSSLDYVYDEFFPVSALYFGNRLYLCAYQEGYEQLEPYLLQEIVAVNGIDISYLQKKAESFINPNQSWESKEVFPRFFFVPAFFDWAGCDYREGYTFQLLNENNEVESIDIPTVSKSTHDQATWVYSDTWESIPYLKGGNWVEYFEEDGIGYIYLYFTEMDYTINGAPWKPFFDEVSETMDTHPDCDKLIIDFRLHPGGNGAVMSYFRRIIAILDDAAIENTYVLTGGFSASGAMECIADFKKELQAITVGEPTGAFTSFFCQWQPEPVTLPNSGMSMWASNYWWEGTPLTEMLYDESGKLYPWENTVLPDVYVYQDIEDIRQGKDSVIEWILAQ